MRRLRFAVIAAVMTALAVTPGAVAAPRSGSGHLTDGTTTRQYVDKTSAIVQLKLAPVTTAAKTKPAPGKKIDFNNSGVKAYRAQLSAQRNDFKQWLRANAPSVKVTGEYDLTLNAVAVKLNGTPISKLREASMVSRVEYEAIYYPTDENDPDLSLINALNAWTTVGGPANAGNGVKVGVIDSGIDATHPCFDDANYPNQQELGDTRFTNDKVIVAKVFNNKAKSRGYTAEAIGYHGTHVAGTIACNLDTPVEMPPLTIPFDMSGVAPRALLGNYNVFPGDVENARSEDILNALDAAFADGMDVMNMSLGGPFPGYQDLLTMAVDNLDIANVVVAVSAGNEGPGHYTVGSPGSAARALTAGATETGQNSVTTFAVDTFTFDAVPGDFGIPVSPLTAPIAILTTAPVNGVSGYSELCTQAAADALPSLTGKIAVLGRGTCDFSTKLYYAQSKGAVGAVVVNRILGEAPFIMGQGEVPGGGAQPTIPGYMISADDGIDLRTANPSVDGENGTMSVPSYIVDGAQVNAQTDFTSQGPTDVDFRVKPDVMAPGGNVISAFPLADCGESATTCFGFLSGTSMASPHLAGAAAVVRGYHPSWTAAQIRSAIVNTAVEGVVTQYDDWGTPETDVNIVGSGLADVDAALHAKVALDPVSISFGAVPSGSGMTASVPVTITNLTGSAHTYYLYIHLSTGGGVTYSVPGSGLYVAAGASKTFWVTMTADKGADLGDNQARFYVEDEVGTVAHAAVYTFVK